MPQPRQKTSELWNRVKALSESDVKNDILIGGLENEAKALLAIDPAGAYAVFGAVACLKKDAERMKEYFGKALSLPLDNQLAQWVQSNFATSLFKLSLFDEAKKHAKQAYEASGRSDVNMLSILTEASTLNGDIGEANLFVGEINKKAPHLAHPIFDDIRMAYDTLQKCDLSDQDIERFLKTSYAVLNQHGYHPDHVVFRFSSNELLYRIYVKAEPRTLAKLEAELADTLVEDDLIPSVSDAITAMYVPVPVGG